MERLALIALIIVGLLSVPWLRSAVGRLAELPVDLLGRLTPLEREPEPTDGEPRRPGDLVDPDDW